MTAATSTPPSSYRGLPTLAGLATLAEAVVASSAGLGEAPAGRPFTGHVTIARSRGSANLRREHELLQPLDLSWEVRSVSLVRSVLNPAGATYNDLATFGLGDSVWEGTQSQTSSAASTPKGG